MFKENELVMYGSTGVCRVKEIGRPSFVTRTTSVSTTS